MHVFSTIDHTNERQPRIGILFIPEHSSLIKSILKEYIVAKVSKWIIMYIQYLSIFLKSIAQ